MDVILLVVELLNSDFGIVFGQFVGFVFEIRSQSLVYHVSAVFGYKNHVVIAAIYTMAIMQIFIHVPKIARRKGFGERIHPTSLRSGI